MLGMTQSDGSMGDSLGHHAVQGVFAVEDGAYYGTPRKSILELCNTYYGMPRGGIKGRERICASIGNRHSISLGDVELQQPLLCRATGFGNS